MENKLRGPFLTVLVAYCVAVLGIAIGAWAQGANTRIWLPVAVAAAQVLLFFARLYVAHVPRTTPGLMGFTLGIFAATMYSVYQSHVLQLASVGPLLAFVVLIYWVGYIMWYSDLDRSTDRIKVGKRLPDINLTDLSGNAVHSRDWAGQRRLVLFVRGNWCPICVAQCIELSASANALEKRGVKVTIISPQPVDKNRALAQKLHRSFEVLCDASNAAAKALNIVQPNGLPMGFQLLGYEPNVPKPTAFIIDQKLNVLWADLTENYRVRPMPEDLLAALDGK